MGAGHCLLKSYRYFQQGPSKSDIGCSLCCAELLVRQPRIALKKHSYHRLHGIPSTGEELDPGVLASSKINSVGSRLNVWQTPLGRFLGGPPGQSFLACPGCTLQAVPPFLSVMSFKVVVGVRVCLFFMTDWRRRKSTWPRSFLHRWRPIACIPLPIPFSHHMLLF